MCQKKAEVVRFILLEEHIDTERRLDVFCVNENVTFPVGNL